QPETGWQVVGLIIALGAITMALLQLVNDLSPVQGTFHLFWLKRWIVERADKYKDARGLFAPDDKDLIDFPVDDAVAMLVWQAAPCRSSVYRSANWSPK